MAKKPGTRLKKLRTSLRRLEKLMSQFPDDVDEKSVMRLCREELGDKAVEVSSLPGDYPNSELSLAEHMVKILCSDTSPEDKSGKKLKDIDNGLTRTEIGLLAAGLLLSDGKLSRKKRTLPKKKLASAKKYLLSLGIKKFSVRGKRLYISAGRREISKIAKSLHRIEKKLKAFGFSEVLLKSVS